MMYANKQNVIRKSNHFQCIDGSARRSGTTWSSWCKSSTAVNHWCESSSTHNGLVQASRYLQIVYATNFAACVLASYCCCQSWPVLRVGLHLCVHDCEQHCRAFAVLFSGWVIRLTLPAASLPITCALALQDCALLLYKGVPANCSCQVPTRCT